MLSLKSFLIEEAYSRNIDIKKAYDLLLEHCSDALKYPDTPLLRGIKNPKSDAFIFQGELGERSSKNSSNHYTILIDHFLPSGYPERSKSIIVGTHEFQVKVYGKIYAIFPYNGVQIGVLDEGDIWFNKIEINGKKFPLDHWNDFFVYNKLSDKSYEEFIHDLKEVLSNNEANKKYSRPGKNPLSLNNIFNTDTLEEDLKKAYTSIPMHSCSTKDVYKYVLDEDDHEMWIGGKCIGIKLNIWEDIKDEI